MLSRALRAPRWGSAVVVAWVAFGVTRLLNLREQPFLLELTVFTLTAALVSVLAARRRRAVPALDTTATVPLRHAELLNQRAEERQHLLERERQARAEAERANRLKDEFLATLSHELRTPLNAVLGWSHMLTRRTLTPEQQKQALAAIHRNAHAQARLVDEVLDLSRIVTGRMALILDVVDVSEIVRATAESFTAAVVAKRQRLHLDLEPGAEITGDPHRLRQISWNLLSNATKFTPAEGTIGVRVASHGTQVELIVSDNGQGIELGFLPYVFDRFRQEDGSTTRGHGGLGLGLALVRHLVEAHGGTIAAASDGPGTGTTVKAHFPARIKDDRPIAPHPAVDEAQQPFGAV